MTSNATTLKPAAATAADQTNTTSTKTDFPSSSPLEKLAVVTVDGGFSTYEVIRITRKGKRFCIALPRAAAKKQSKLLDAALDAGADLPENLVRSKHMVNQVIESSPTREGGTIVTRWGWFGEPGRVFLLNNDAIQSQERRTAGDQQRRSFSCAHFDGTLPYNVLGPDALSDQSDGVFHRRGSLADWKRHVAPLAKYSSILRLVTAAALAAPLLRLLGTESFILVLTGRTTLGKTTAELYAGSVIGRATPEDLYNWKISEPRLEEVARFHNDTLLLVDDFATIEGSDIDRFKSMRGIVHWLTAGGRRGKQKKAIERNTGRSDSHSAVRTIVLTSYEHPVVELARRAKRTLDGGDHVRLLDVPVGGTGSVGIIDWFPDSVRNRHAFAAKCIHKIRRMSASYHGTAYRAWLQVLVDDPAKAKLAASKARDHFMEIAGYDGTDTAQMRHAMHFALHFAAGMYAIQCKILPWSESDFEAAILKHYAASRKRLIRAQAGLADGLDRLAAKLRGKSVKAWPVAGIPTLTPDTDGWRRVGANTCRFVIIGDSFRRWFASDAQRNQVMQHLVRLGFMKRTKTTDVRIKSTTGKKVRCYFIDVPAGHKLAR